VSELSKLRWHLTLGSCGNCFSTALCPLHKPPACGLLCFRHPSACLALPCLPASHACRRALEQLEDDVGRVDLSEQWRPYSRLRMQQPEGPPLSKMQKLRVGGAGAGAPWHLGDHQLRLSKQGPGLLSQPGRRPCQSLPLSCRRSACLPAHLSLPAGLAGRAPARGGAASRGGRFPGPSAAAD
jgi:hypothetical protein